MPHKSDHIRNKFSSCIKKYKAIFAEKYAKERSIARNEDGATAVEYVAVAVGLVALVLATQEAIRLELIQGAEKIF